jgi:uncharacterized protein (DUF1015 family)
MPDIRSFRGILYNSEKIKDFAKVVTEPYDVISPSQQQAYHKLHPYNIIHLILGKQKPGDNAKNNQYTRAKRYFNLWREQDILLRDDQECIYIYAQTFCHNDKKKTRTGFIVLMKLEDFAKNAILPHENTFSQPVQDRLKLLKTVRANLSPIFAIFNDRQGKINKLLSEYKRHHTPYTVFEKDKVLHRLWRMNDTRKIATIKKLLKNQQIFIADGHHRYEAALNYKIDMQRPGAKTGRNSTGNFVMTYLAATTDRGLTILPTHRAVKIKTKIDFAKIIQSLKKSFVVRTFFTSDDLFSYMRKSGTQDCVFGVYAEKNKFFGLQLKNKNQVYKLVGRTGRTSNKSLDVAILHEYIIAQIIKISPNKEDICYTRDAQEAIQLVNKNRYQMAFFLRPPTVTQVKKVARAGERMPHKSTYFYPKLLTGLVINALEGKA